MIKSKYKKNLDKPFKSKNGLIFEQATFDYDPNFLKFRIGTCSGLWGVEGKSYVIIAIVNDQPGNGHFEDVLEWFERSCRRDGYSLKIVEFFNDPFKKHLIEKRGFKEIPNGVEKIFS